MGLLKKLHLVEEIPGEPVDDYVPADEYEDIPVETDGVQAESFVQDVYEKNDLSDQTRSIFKVEELINSFPKEMPAVTKKASVLATLGVFALTLDEVEEDAKKRCDVLDAAFTAIKKEKEAEIAENETAIEARKQEIEELENKNAALKGEINAANNQTSAEIARIDALWKFVGGNE